MLVLHIPLELLQRNENPMEKPMQTIRRRVVSLAAGILFILLIVWLFTPYRIYAAGFFLGVCVSVYNTLYLSSKMRRITEAALAQGRAGIGAGAGMLQRYLMVTLALLIAMMFPQHFHPLATIAGVPVCYILLPVFELWETQKASRV